MSAPIRLGFAPPWLTPTPPSARLTPPSTHVVHVEDKVAEPPLGAPLPEPGHESRAMELVLDPSGDGVTVSPQRGELIAPLGSFPDGRVQTSVDCTDLGQRSVEV